MAFFPCPCRPSSPWLPSPPSSMGDDGTLDGYAPDRSNGVTAVGGWKPRGVGHSVRGGRTNRTNRFYVTSDNYG
jgi:hypothetical protein